MSGGPMAYFTFELVTPERVVLRQEADQVTLPTPDGEITLLPHHVPLVTLVAAGELRLRSGDEETPLAVHGGYLEVQGRIVRLLTDAAERVEEIDEARAEAAKRRAEQLREEHAADRVKFAEATALLERSLARLRIARKYRGRRARRRASPGESRPTGG